MQTNFMHKRLLIYLIIFALSASLTAGLFPYPMFSSYTNVTDKNMVEIANVKESELEVESDNEVKVLAVDWEVANAIIECFTPYRLIDIESGISIMIERTGGKNHADIETIDENNTLLLYEIYNGTPSWDRRPVYLEYRENVYFCASLTGFPHGESKGENGLGGHVCLHFKNSKTHGSFLKDKTHQKNITYAYKNRNKITELL